MKRKRKRFETQWVRLDRRWVKALRQSKSVSTYQLAHTILFEAFKREQVGGEIVLSMEVTKMPASTRKRAIASTAGKQLGWSLYYKKETDRNRIRDLFATGGKSATGGKGSATRGKAFAAGGKANQVLLPWVSGPIVLVMGSRAQELAPIYRPTNSRRQVGDVGAGT